MSNPTKQTVICEEVFDDTTSQPSVSEIHEYASKLGIDPVVEPQLLPLAAEGLMKPLPTNWKPCYDDKRKAYYYHDNFTGRTQWEHPLDNVYRGLVTKARTESQSLSLGEPTEDATYTRDDLPSYEEPFAALPPRQLSPLRVRPKLAEISKMQRSEERPSSVPGKISLNLFSSLDETNLKVRKPEEMRVSGGGSMFLKSNTKKPAAVKPTVLGGESISPEENESDENPDCDPIFLKCLSKQTGKPHLRSILRDTIESKEEDDKKSVRFNMETTPNLYFAVSDDSETESNKDKDALAIPPAAAKSSRFTVVPVQETFKSREAEIEQLLESETRKQEEDFNRKLEQVRLDFESRLTTTSEKETLKLDEKKLELGMFYETEETNFKNGLAAKFEETKRNLEGKFEGDVEKLERELRDNLEKRKDELIVSHNAILDQIRQNHAAVLSELQQDYKSEEDILRREHHKLISELRNKIAREVDAEKISPPKDAEDERLYEKVRCEKRLLEDKYRCLKDKYLKLKTEVKLSIEKRNRKKEQNLTTNTNTTGSETEKSPADRKERIQHHSPSAHKRPSPKHPKSLQNNHKFNRHIVVNDQDTSASDASYILNDDSSDFDCANPTRSRKKLSSRLKSSRLNNNVKSQRSCSPVENLRKQLQKLEDLEDQFPQNAQGDTYHLRYPFSDAKFEGSSELEFFRHRIHLERDSIRRAKDSLRKQKSHFKQRQDELKLKHGPSARSTLKQLYQEEKELTDMEVSLHRTRSLLGEKVIRLRHLEQSLHRASGPNDPQHDDATLSDLSSHSASSGISSSDFVLPDGPVKSTQQFKESSEIIQSLENLNLEIREIWDVLHKQQQTGNVANVFPPLPLLYPDLGWPLLAAASGHVPPSIPTLADRLQNYRQHVALANAQSTVVTHDTQGATTTLVEKTRNLRQWLRQTTVDVVATDGGIVPEASL